MWLLRSCVLEYFEVLELDMLEEWMSNVWVDVCSSRVVGICVCVCVCVWGEQESEKKQRRPYDIPSTQMPLKS